MYCVFTLSAKKVANTEDPGRGSWRLPRMQGEGNSVSGSHIAGLSLAQLENTNQATNY